MQLSRRQLQAMMLADTVAFPPAFPELGRLTYHRRGVTDSISSSTRESDLLVVEQHPSPKLTISRTFLTRDVAGLFIPKSYSAVDFNHGTWLLGAEIAELEALAKSLESPLMGIAYVHERASTLLQVEIGMTAAESAEYYPPLPDDRTSNHYNFPMDLCTDKVGVSHSVNDLCTNLSVPLTARPDLCT
jgi:hypothetical protein